MIGGGPFIGKEGKSRKEQNGIKIIGGGRGRTDGRTERLKEGDRQR